MESLRLMHVFPDLHGGGTEDVILKLSDYIYGHTNAVIGICATAEGGLRKSDFEELNIEIFDIPHFQNKKKLGQNLLKIKKSLSLFKPDIVHTHSLYSLILVYLARKISRLNYRIVHTGHGGPQENYDELAKKYFWMADAYVTISKYSYDYLSSASKKEHVHLIYNGTTEPPLNEVVQLKQNYDTLKLAFVGRVVRQKGLSVLIDAVHLLSLKGYKVSLDVVGDGELLESLKKKVDEKKLTDSVHFLGFLKQPWSKITDCPVVVVPSLWEPGGLVAIEAILRDHTVVASSTGGLKDRIKSGSNGYLFDVEDAEGLANQLMNIFDNDAYIHLTHEEKKAYVFKEDSGPSYLQLYDELLKS
ncbi:glycosyltransferase family 4 protein [Priestia megaterium]|uniref:glycosyltransferase family 4 protein n=1 Tax=Priestia TaxID=2800373 RepID=UPI0035E20EF3